MMQCTVPIMQARAEGNCEHLGLINCVGTCIRLLLYHLQCEPSYDEKSLHSVFFDGSENP
jgi:hypothetical protein